MNLWLRGSRVFYDNEQLQLLVCVGLSWVLEPGLYFHPKSKIPHPHSFANLHPSKPLLLLPDMHTHISTSQSLSSCLAQLFSLCKSLLGGRRILKYVLWFGTTVCTRGSYVRQEGASVQDLSPMLCPQARNLKCQSHDKILQHLATTNSHCLSSTHKNYTKSSKDIQFCYFASNFLSGSENPTMNSPISSSGFPEACTFALQKSGMEIF